MPNPTQHAPPRDLNTREIASFSQKLIEAIKAANITSDSAQSVVTTIFANSCRNYLEESSPENLENDRQQILQVLEHVSSNIRNFQQKAPDARSSQDGSTPGGQDGDTNRASNGSSGNGGG